MYPSLAAPPTTRQGDGFKEFTAVGGRLQHATPRQQRVNGFNAADDGVECLPRHQQQRVNDQRARTASQTDLKSQTGKRNFVGAFAGSPFNLHQRRQNKTGYTVSVRTPDVRKTPTAELVKAP